MDEARLINLKGLVSEFALLSANSSTFSDTASFCDFEVAAATFATSRAAIRRILDEEGLADHWLVNEDDEQTTKINFNKKKLVADGVIFFLRQSSYLEWIHTENAFDANSFFADLTAPRAIILPDLDNEYSGPALQILSARLTATPNAAKYEPDAFRWIPNSKKIRERVFVIADNTVIDPQRFLLYNPDITEYIRPIVRASVLTLAASLAQELKTNNIVTVRGLRRLELSLYEPKDLDDEKILELQGQIVACVSWIYEERSETRSKLISDRLSLDVADQDSFVFGLKKYLTGALEDARERYGYVISEASDEFYKEKRSIQSEVNKQLQSYGTKTKDLIASILRDTLAGLFLVGFSLFGPSKPQDIPSLLTNKYINILFKGLAIYFTVSLVIQAAVIITDILQSRSELVKYASATRNYMRPDEISAFIDESLSGREKAFWIFFGIIAIIYVGIILFCLYFPDIAVIPNVIPIATPIP